MKEDIIISRELACDLLKLLINVFDNANVGNQCAIEDVAERLAEAMMISDWRNQKKY